MFIDTAEIFVQSGKGGDGAVHFRREKYIPRGGPDGGDGGKGGDVALEVKPSLNTLAHFRHKQRFIADDGRPGGPNNRYGKSASDLIIYVPPGTVVYDADSGETLGDLTEPGQRLILCKGGRGGRGNTHFKSSRRQVPKIAEKGEPGQERHIRLELRLIADIGLIGVPNAGKSTLLSVLTNAKPKIAPYPFTTLSPNLGVARVDEYHTVVLADIPGLIEGASQGAGLGHEFLRHVQRTRVLIHLIDGLSAEPLADFSQINSELALFDPRLAEKPQLVAFNKIDQPAAQARWPEIKEALAARGYAVMAISAMTRENVRELLLQAADLLAHSPELQPPDMTPVYRPPEDPREFHIERLEAHEWRIHGAAIERAAAMTYWEYDAAIRRFQKIIQTLGIIDALRQAGVQPGDTVHIGEFELEFTE